MEKFRVKNNFTVYDGEVQGKIILRSMMEYDGEVQGENNFTVYDGEVQGKN